MKLSRSKKLREDPAMRAALWGRFDAWSLREDSSYLADMALLAKDGIMIAGLFFLVFVTDAGQFKNRVPVQTQADMVVVAAESESWLDKSANTRCTFDTTFELANDPAALALYGTRTFRMTFVHRVPRVSQEKAQGKCEAFAERYSSGIHWWSFSTKRPAEYPRVITWWPAFSYVHTKWWGAFVLLGAPLMLFSRVRWLRRVRALQEPQHHEAMALSDRLAAFRSFRKPAATIAVISAGSVLILAIMQAAISPPSYFPTEPESIRDARWVAAKVGQPTNDEGTEFQATLPSGVTVTCRSDTRTTAPATPPIASVALYPTDRGDVCITATGVDAASWTPNWLRVALLVAAIYWSTEICLGLIAYLFDPKRMRKRGFQDGAVWRNS